MLSLDKDLNKILNIKKATANDIPEDFYTTIAIFMKGTIKVKLESLKINENEFKLIEVYERLDKLDLIREIIKKTIMTIPYNVSLIPPKGGIRYLKESFVFVYGDNIEYIEHISPRRGGENNNIEENTTHNNDQ